MLGTRSLGRTRSQDRKRTSKRASSSPKATPKSGKVSVFKGSIDISNLPTAVPDERH